MASKTVNLPFSPDDIRNEWRCAGCGIAAPGRISKCDCPTSCVVNGKTSAWKADRETVEVRKLSLLKVVRKLDCNADISAEEFAAAFDDLRGAFTADEVSTGKP